MTTTSNATALDMARTAGESTFPAWAMDAIRELIDIGGLLNDEMFLVLEGLDAKQAIVQRLTALAESITLDGEPQALEEAPDGSDY